MTLRKGARTLLAASGTAFLLLSSVAVADIISGAATTGSSSDVTVTQLTLAKPTGVVAGDLLLASIAVNGGSAASVSAPTGWVQVIRTDNDVNVALITYSKTATGSEPNSYTWQVDNQTTAQGGITRYSTVHPSTPIQGSSGNSGHGTVATTTPLTTVSASTTVVQVFAIDAGKSSSAGAYFSTPAGTSEKYDTSNSPFGPSIASFDAIQAGEGSTGSVSSNLNSNKALSWAAQTIVITGISPLPQDNFNSYTYGSLTGSDGGSGWTSPWTGSTRFDVTNSVTYEGSGAVHALQTYGFVEPEINRTFAPRTSGTLHWVARKDGPDHTTNVTLKSGETWVTSVQIMSDTQDGRAWGIRNGFSSETVQAYTLGTFDAVDMQFDTDTDMYRVSINGGTYTDWKHFVNNVNVSYVDSVTLQVSGSGFGDTDMYWDDLRFTQ